MGRDTCGASPANLALGRCLGAVTFIVFGAAILGPALDDLGGEGTVYAVLSLTTVRCCRRAGAAKARPTLLSGLVRPGASRRSSSP